MLVKIDSLTLALTFGNPSLLWGLVLILVPPLLHLLFRRTQHVEPWGAMRFLQQAIRRRRQRLRLESLLQLAVRSSLLGVIVLAAADPRTPAAPGASDSLRQIHRLLILDTSLSTQATDGVQSAFERMIKSTEQILADARPGDSFQVMQATQTVKREVVAQPSFDHDAVLKEIQLLDATYDRGEMVKTLLEAASLLELGPVDSVNELLILSDFQSREWLTRPGQPHSGLRELIKGLSTKADVSLIDTGVEPLPNSTLEDLRPARSWVFTNQPMLFSFDLRHDGTADTMTADVLVDGAPHSRQQVSLVRGRGTGTVAVTFLTPGEHRVEVSIPADGLLADNQLQSIVQVRRSLNILITGEPDSTQRTAIDYIETALSLSDFGTDQGSADFARFEVEKISESSLRGQDLNQVDCLIIRNPSLLQPLEVAQVAAFVRTGGGLIISPATKENLASFNSLFFREFPLAPMSYLEIESQPVVLETPQFFETDLTAHPVLAPFEGYPDSGFRTTRVYRHFPVKDVSSSSRVIVRTARGEPLIAEREYGHGRVMQLAMPFDPEWTSWVVWPSFIPMLHQAVQHVSDGRVKTPQLTVGDPFEWELPDSKSITDFQLIKPDGEVLPPSLLKGEQTTLSFSGTSSPGRYYLVHARDKKSIPLTVRIPLDETGLSYTPPNTLAATLLADLPVRVGNYQTAAVTRDFRSGSRPDHSPGRLTELLLALAALLLLTDVLAGRSLPVAVLCLVTGLAAILLVLFVEVSPVTTAVALGGTVLLILTASRFRRKRSPNAGIPANGTVGLRAHRR